MSSACASRRMLSAASPSAHLPLGMLALVAGLRLLRSRAPRSGRRSTSAVRCSSSSPPACSSTPLIEGRQADWAPWTFASISGLVVVLGLFVALERRRERAAARRSSPRAVLQRAFSAGLCYGARVLRGHDRADAHLHAAPTAGRGLQRDRVGPGAEFPVGRQGDRRRTRRRAARPAVRPTDAPRRHRGDARLRARHRVFSVAADADLADAFTHVLWIEAGLLWSSPRSCPGRGATPSSHAARARPART